MGRKLSVTQTSSFISCAVLFVACLLPCFAEEGPAPGAELEARQKLYDRIQQARSQGIGIGGYMQAFKALEDQVKAGDSGDKINPRIEAINKAVSDQLARAKVLKTQKPLPPQGSQISGSGSPAAAAPPPASASAAGAKDAKAGGDSSGAGGGASDIVTKLKEKYGDRIPNSLKDRLLNDPSILQKLKERAGHG